MKKAILAAISVGLWMAAASGIPLRPEAAPVIETVKLSGLASGNYRYPAVAENKNGDRLAIFRGPDNFYLYSVSKMGGAWSSPVSIPGQPYLKDHLTADVEADSAGRFHCVWEEPGLTCVYATFLDGAWTAPVQFGAGSHEYGVSLGLRSNDQVVACDCRIVWVPGLTKDIFLSFKNKGELQFGSAVNVTFDNLSSAQAQAAVDAKDHVWIAYKHEDDPGPPETRVTRLIHLDENNEVVEKLYASGDDRADANYWPSIAVNTEGKVMSVWAFSQGNDYWSRLYDPARRKLSSLVPLKIGLSTNPWCTFFSRMAAHGKDFYAAAINPGRILYLLKYDEAASRWDVVAQISDRGVDTFDLYSGYDKMLVVWGGFIEPTDVFVTTVAVDPLVPPTRTLTIQSGPGGTTNPAPGTYTHPRNSVVPVAAVPDPAYRFASWSGDASGASPSISVTLDADKTVKADFQFVIQPPLNVRAERKVERGFFNGYALNVLTWDANPLNSQPGDVVAAYRIYRKLRTEAETQWVRIAEIPPSTRTYVDSRLLLTLDYVYAASSVHLNGDESAYSANQ